MKLRPTRHPELAYTKLSPTDWRFVMTVPGEACAIIGSIYKSKAELLADIDAFYKERFQPSENK